MGKIIMGKVLAAPLSVILDGSEGPEDTSFLDEYNKRSKKQIARDKVCNILNDFGLLDVKYDYVLAFKSSYPFHCYIIDMDGLFKTYPQLPEYLREQLTEEMRINIQELFNE